MEVYSNRNGNVYIIDPLSKLCIRTLIRFIPSDFYLHKNADLGGVLMTVIILFPYVMLTLVGLLNGLWQRTPQWEETLQGHP